MGKIFTNKKIIKAFCYKNLHTHTDWTGTRVETIEKCESLNDFINQLWDYLENNSDRC